MKKSLMNSVMAMIICLAVGSAFGAQTIQVGNNQNDVRLLSQDQTELLMEVSIGEIGYVPVNTSEGQFTMLTVNGFARSHNIGEPSLPMINRVISIPYGCQLEAEVVNYSTEEINLADYGITNQLMPAQPSLSKSDDPDYLPFEYNREAYSQAGYYELPLTQTDILGVLRAHRIGKVSVAPISYDPVANTLKVYTDITVRVRFLNPDWITTEQIQRRLYSPYFEVVYSRLFNYNNDYPVILDDLVTYPVKYLIISDRMFESQLQPVIDWKTKKGFTVMTAYTDDIGYSNTVIRQYIQNVYNTEDPPPSFVLLVGDDQQIPAFNMGAHISDLNFCEFTGDHMPEIYYGRWSAQNTNQLQPQIDKTLEYEMYTMPDPSYLGEVSLVAGVDAGHAPTWGNGQINYGTDYYFNMAHNIDAHVWLYPQSDDPGAGAAIRATINHGIGLVNYSAHCGHEGWSDPSFNQNDIRGLTNAHKYLLSIGNCCLSNTFGSDYSDQCFGEVWLEEPSKGGIGHIGGTNSTYWDEDYWWGVGAGPVLTNPTYEQTGLGAYDGLFHDHGEPEYLHYVTNDALIFCGNMAVVEGGSSMINYYWEIYTLMGDPSILSYMGVPTDNDITHDPAVLLTAPSFTVQADPGSYVGISMNGVLHGQGYVDRTGMVDIPLQPFPQPGTADIVITSQNRIPYLSTITVVTPEGPYVVYDNYEINDSNGNNNGQADFGEHILLDMQVSNVGPDPAQNVQATLSTEDELITITDDTEMFGNIAGDFDSARVADAFAFDISGQTEDGHVVAFDLTCTDDDSHEWTSRFTLPVHAPVLELGTVSIDDHSGNGNGIMDPGETIIVTVTLANTGSCAADNVVATLSEDDDYATIGDADGSFGNIAPDGEADNSGNTFEFTVSNDLPMGHTVFFDMAVAGDGGYTIDMQFAISAIESFEFSDGGWSGNGVWEWGQPTSGPGAAYDGAKVWGTVLGGAYPDNADDYLYTAEYNLNGSNFSLSFYQWYDFETRYDGGNIHISTDGGSTWDLLTPEGGYPNNAIVGLDGEPGFTSSSGDWVLTTVDLSDYCGQNVILGFRFGSDGSVTRDGWYIDAVVIQGDVGLFPSCEISHGSMNIGLNPGETNIVPLHIANIGEANLQFSALAVTDEVLANGLNNHDNPVRTAEPDVTITKHDGLVEYNYTGHKSAEVDTPDGGLITDFGGPDGYGYTWKDSNEPNGPEYNWIDITGFGDPINGMDDDTNLGPFDIGFDFPFYGEFFNSFNICSNGWLSFTSTATEYSNAPLPSGDEPYNLVAPFWDDQDFGDGGQLYYYSNQDSLIVSFINVPHYSVGGPYTYQMILLSNGDIIFQYAELYDPLNSCTIGIQNGDGSDGLQIANDNDYVFQELAVKIRHPLFWLTIDPTEGTLEPGGAMDMDVIFDATGLDYGLYTGQIVLTTNDPENQTIAVPCSLTVGIVDVDDAPNSLPSVFLLDQNFPNPFNPTTEISFGLPASGQVTLEVFDVMGRKVTTLVNGDMTAGIHKVIWDGNSSSGEKVTSGMYFYKLTQGDNTVTKKMLMLK